MKDDNNKFATNKTLLILFPRGGIGQKIAQTFLQNGYRVTIIAGDGQRAEQIEQVGTENLHIHKLAPEKQFWSNDDAHAVDDILSAAVVIYCAEMDFLKLNSTGVLDEWQIDIHSDPQKKLSFVDQLLNRRSTPGPSLWINLALGTSMRQNMGADYCKTRYGMIGFSKILELNPKFAGMTILNICLSFFRHRIHNRTADYCSHCTTTELRAALTELRDENDLVNYLLAESERLNEQSTMAG